MNFFLLVIFFSALRLLAQTPEEVRLQAIEKRLNDFDAWYTEYYLESKGRMAPFLSEKISFGGFFETGILHLTGEDMPTQTSANSNALGINIAAEFNERVRFVSQLISVFSYRLDNPHNNPALIPTQREYRFPEFLTLVAQGYLEIRNSELFSVQAGIGYVSFGRSLQLREPVLFKRRTGPQITNTLNDSTVGIAFPLWMGVHVMGSTIKGSDRVGYNLYSFSPSVNPKSLGGGGRLWLSNTQNLTLGISYQSGKQNLGAYSALGADVNFASAKYGFVAEYARNSTSGVSSQPSTYYFEPYYVLKAGEWVVYGAADYLNDRNRTVGGVPDPFEKWEFGGGINWLPLPNSRYRLGFLTHDYLGDTDTLAGQKRDYLSVDLSAGIAF